MSHAPAEAVFPLRLAYWNPDPLPSALVRTQQLLWTLVELAKLGASIDLFSPGSWRDGRPRGERESAIERFYALPRNSFSGRLRHVELRLPSLPQVRYSFLRRAAHGLRAGLQLRRAGYDLIYTRDLLALTGCLASGLPAVLETHRANINQLHRFRPWRRLVYARRNLFGVIAHSRYAFDSFRAAGIAEDRLLLAYNGYAPEQLHPCRSRAEARALLGLDQAARLVVYAGSFRPGKGTDVLAPIAARLPGVSFLLVGAEPASEDERRLLDAGARAGARNFHLMPRVAPSEVTAYLQAADIVIIPPTAEPLARGLTVLPIKTFLYLAAGRAVVAPDLPDIREVLRHDENAFLVKPGDSEACAAAIGGLLEDGAQRERIAQRGARDATAYTWERRAERIFGFLAGLTARDGVGRGAALGLSTRGILHRSR
jgi:glycosyltransferase involved in cell wall biosynthesis